MAGIRAGRIWVGHGDLIAGLDMRVRVNGNNPGAPLGAKLAINEGDTVDVIVTINLQDGPNFAQFLPQLAKVDLIVGDIVGPATDRDSFTTPSTKVVQSWDTSGRTGTITLKWGLGKVDRPLYVRLRGSDGKRLGAGLPRRVDRPVRAGHRRGRGRRPVGGPLVLLQPDLRRDTEPVAVRPQAVSLPLLSVDTALTSLAETEHVLLGLGRQVLLPGDAVLCTHMVRDGEPHYAFTLVTADVDAIDQVAAYFAAWPTVVSQDQPAASSCFTPRAAPGDDGGVRP